jgi:hypothetical protein
MITSEDSETASCSTTHVINTPNNPVTELGKKLFKSIDNLIHVGRQKSVDLTERIVHKSYLFAFYKFR